MPQLSIGGFAKFMKASPAKQRSLLRDFKFPRTKEGKKKPQIMRYSEARATVRRYHENNNDIDTLLRAVEALTKKMADHPEKDKGRIQDNIRAIQTYMKYYSKNLFTVLKLPHPKYEHGTVQVSATPDLYVEANSEKRIIKLDFNQQKPDPEVIQIMLKVMYEAASVTNLGVKPKGVVYLDVSRQAQYTGEKLNKSLKKEIDAACETIADMWPNIKPI